MIHREKGWLGDPMPLAESGKPADMRSGGFDVACTFGVEQADQLRACDDLKQSLTNTACRAHTPIKLASRDHSPQLRRTFAADGRDWAL